MEILKLDKSKILRSSMTARVYDAIFFPPTTLFHEDI